MFTTSGVTIGTGSSHVIDVPGSSKEPAVQPTQCDQQREDDIRLKSCKSLLDSVVAQIRRTSSTLP